MVTLGPAGVSQFPEKRSEDKSAEASTPTDDDEAPGSPGATQARLESSLEAICPRPASPQSGRSPLQAPDVSNDFIVSQTYGPESKDLPRAWKVTGFATLYSHGMPTACSSRADDL